MDMNNMTDDQIIAEFEELLGGGKPPEDTDPEPGDNNDPNPEDKPPEGGSGEGEGEGNNPDAGAEEGAPGAAGEGEEGKKQHDKQAQAFYALRNKNKANENLIKNLGSVLGFDPKASSEDIVAKVETLITQKQAKDQGIPAEVLTRIQELEKQVQDNEAVKIEAKVTKDLTTIAEKYGLGEDKLTEFVLKLAENGKNPLENPDIDLNTEYISMYFDQLIADAKKAALDEEQARKDKIDQGPGGLPGKGGSAGDSGEKIQSVSDLDKLFDGMTI